MKNNNEFKDMKAVAITVWLTSGKQIIGDPITKENMIEQVGEHAIEEQFDNLIDIFKDMKNMKYFTVSHKGETMYINPINIEYASVTIIK